MYNETFSGLQSLWSGSPWLRFFFPTVTTVCGFFFPAIFQPPVLVLWEKSLKHPYIPPYPRTSQTIILKNCVVYIHNKKRGKRFPQFNTFSRHSTFEMKKELLYCSVEPFKFYFFGLQLSKICSVVSLNLKTKLAQWSTWNRLLMVFSLWKQQLS